MGSKHLRQLLDEDQEPFLLQNYIDERRCQLRKPVLLAKPNLRIRRSRKISPRSLCKNACFSPDLNKSPLFYFSSSPAKTPCRNPDALFIHVPSRTAALLLEAALRIQRPKSHKSLGFGFFGSIMSKLGHRSRNRKREIMEDRMRVSVKDILRRDSTDMEDKRVPDLGLSCSCDKYADLDTSTSRFGDCSDEKETESSPISRLPELESPARSPSRLKNQVVKNEEGQQNVVEKGYEEEEKEHSSPVSVLDPQFEDDNDYEGREDDDEQEDSDGLQLERSFANVQRTKQKLLLKLRRFEKLAELDPIELENRILEDEGGECDDDDSWSSVEEDKSTLFAREVLNCSNLHNFQRVPPDIKKLILDLADEEEGAAAGFEDRELLAKRLCKRLGSWKDAEMETIDMMVEFDLRSEGHEHWGNKEEEEEHVQDISALIELCIFRFLVDEFSQELVHDSCYYL